MSNGPTITIGNCAGHHFHGQADLEVVKHCTRGTQRGFYHQRKRLVDRKVARWMLPFVALDGAGYGRVHEACERWPWLEDMEAPE